jgi:hypothetical protein
MKKYGRKSSDLLDDLLCGIQYCLKKGKSKITCATALDWMKKRPQEIAQSVVNHAL